MSLGTLVKICGIKTPDAMTAAIEGGADFVGLVFESSSPRYVEIEVAKYLAAYVPPSTKIIGLFVDPKEKTLTEVLSNVRLDMIQLHGQETPGYAAYIKGRFQKPIIKALGIGSSVDLDCVKDYFGVCDWLLLDAAGTGGGGKSFDWGLLKGFKSPIPWMLAGGLNADNVGTAIRNLKPNAVDVSSGVESTRGVKNPTKIRDFINAAKKI